MSYEAALRHRLEELQKQLEAGKIFIAPHLVDGVRESLAAMRYNADGEIDLDLVDGRIRAMALAISAMKQREEAKEVSSLRDVQSAYFQSIENNFGDIFRKMRTAKSNPHSYSFVLSRNNENVEYLYKVIPQFIEQIVEFWTNASDIVKYHLQDMAVIKGVFGGDLFPSYENNIASTCGLYLDTIVLTDPFMNSRVILERADKREAVRYFLKHALHVLTYKDLAMADVDPPIVVILPFESSFDDEEKNVIGEWALADALTHAGKIFGRSFEGREELLEFGAALDTTEKLVAVIADKSRLLFDVDWKEPLDEQVNRSLKEFGAIAGAENAGLLVASQCFGRMMQATDVMAKSRSLGGTPLIDAPTSWQYLNWKLEYDAPRDDRDVPLHMLHGLQRAGKTDLEWLGDIPPAALIEIRQQGALQEIRDVLTKGVEDVANTNPSNFFRTTDHIVDNIQRAFSAHQDNIDNLRRKNLKFWGHDIGAWIVSGSIGVAAAFSPVPALAVAALAADQVMDIPKLREIPGRFKKLRDENKIVKNSPMGLFFRHVR